LEIGKELVLPRPTASSGEAGESLANQINFVRATMARPFEGLPSDQGQWTDEKYGRWLLAHLLEVQRREDKSAWWEYFRLCKLSDTELQEDKSSLGGLIYLGEVGKEKKSLIHRYRFPPQDHALDHAREVHDPRTEKSAGELVTIDELE